MGRTSAAKLSALMAMALLTGCKSGPEPEEAPIAAPIETATPPGAIVAPSAAPPQINPTEEVGEQMAAGAGDSTAVGGGPGGATTNATGPAPAPGAAARDTSRR